MVEHSSTNPKVRFDSGPSLIPGSWIMMRHVQSYSWSGPQLTKGCGCIGFLFPMHKKTPDSYSQREGGNPGNSGLFVSTIDGSTLPQDCEEEELNTK